MNPINSETKSEAEFIGNYKLDHLYTHDFKNGEGRYFNIVTEDNTSCIEYFPPFPVRNRVSLKIKFIKEKNEIKEVSFSNYKQLKAGWTKTGEVVFTHFSFQKLATFLKYLSELDLPGINERRVSIQQVDNGEKFDSETSKKIRTLLIHPDGQKIVDELINSGMITSRDIVNIGYRKRQVEIFDKLLHEKEYLLTYKNENNIKQAPTEKVWQHFFRKNEWIFGFGLDYRFLSILQNEAHIANADIAGKDGAIIDSLLGSSKFTVLVEMKKPDTPLFKSRQDRANSWKLSGELIDAVSQILEQRASWQISAERNANQNFNDKGELIKQKTLDPKSILIIGSNREFSGSEKEIQIKQRTFELFHRDSRNIEILTYDELFERAKFMVEHSSNSRDK